VRWYYPAWNGDFRLEADGDKASLIVHEPTVAEQEQLTKFLKLAAEKGWTDATNVEASSLEKFFGRKKATIQLGASVADAGAELTKIVSGQRRGGLTAVRFENGKLEVTESIETKKVADLAAKAEEAGHDLPEGADQVDQRVAAADPGQPLHRGRWRLGGLAVNSITGMPISG
jgi:hypothetical protein